MQQSFLTKLVLKLGLAKDERQVPAVLVAIAILALVIMFIVWPKGGGDDNQLPSPSELSMNNAYLYV